MKFGNLPILLFSLFTYVSIHASNEPVSSAPLRISADKMTSLVTCIYNADSNCITSTKDGSSLILGDSIDFGDGLNYNKVEVNISLTYGEIYGQHTGELDLYIDNETTPFASARIALPVKWDLYYSISTYFMRITGKHTVKVLWDWYAANLKNITFSFDSNKFELPEQEIRIACLGNSITEGTEAGDRINKGYVGLLDQLLGKGYQVRNYGSSGATACRNTYNSFSAGPFCKSALSFEPDIVTISLGTNDSQSAIWNTGTFALNFEADYIYLIDLFINLKSHPAIYLCLPPPVFPNTNWGHQPGVLADKIIPIILKIADEKGLEVIDFYNPLIAHNEYYAANDQLHPLAAGHVVMAQQMFKKLSGR